MSKDNRNTVDHNGSGSEKPKRDASGRWVKGCRSPNAKGRPMKMPQPNPLDVTDMRHFGETFVDVAANGKPQKITRRAALLNKMFEDAMKGKVTSQRFLYKEFAKNDEMLVEARIRYDELILWCAEFNRLNRKSVIPLETEIELASLKALLNHYYPGSYTNDDLATNDSDDS